MVAVEQPTLLLLLILTCISYNQMRELGEMRSIRLTLEYV
mgnify:CR=1 FL=1